ncbi:MAG: RnfH family protein [Pseudomonadales bacterium]
MTGAAASVEIDVVYARPERQHRIALVLAPGATVADALAAVAEHEAFSGLDLDAVPVGVFGDRVSRQRVLQSGDRLEIYRPLQVDPREARRRRARSAASRRR